MDNSISLFKSEKQKIYTKTGEIIEKKTEKKVVKKLKCFGFHKTQNKPEGRIKTNASHVIDTGRSVRRSWERKEEEGGEREREREGDRETIVEKERKWKSEDNLTVKGRIKQTEKVDEIAVKNWKVYAQ